MKIYTTLDPALQKTAESAIDTELTKVESRPGYKHPRKAEFSAQAKAEEPSPIPTVAVGPTGVQAGWAF